MKFNFLRSTDPYHAYYRFKVGHTWNPSERRHPRCMRTLCDPVMRVAYVLLIKHMHCVPHAFPVDTCVAAYFDTA